jgi:hypothetical protein
LKAKLLAEGKPTNDGMFKGDGKYATFEKRVNGAHDLKLVDDVTRDDAHLMRRVRNMFAHGKDKLHFDSKGIVELLQQMSTFEAAEHNQDAFLQSSRNVFEQTRQAIQTPQKD